ncbi:hypothetical protein NF27_BK00360 [Candidatus Jidaibacter acanthamoeba]|uniref:Uncharacterized protein n=1 Tax=Candidatus Jidaibacter acanthamoebae TaxID=86105 RepID=A0A0C1R1E8_9RICK|nr:hypothetical protein [Candidatus Jidaibacter acanthamoeba]KIE06115.1 hypothetical protein NF27_BK00360 [Candidatus Jidaibacter acanthamoeba]
MKEEIRLPRSTQIEIGKSANNFNDRIKIIIKKYAENFEREIQKNWDSERRYLIGHLHKDALKAEVRKEIAQVISDYLEDLGTNFKVSYKGSGIKFSLNSKGERELTTELWDKITEKPDISIKDTGELEDKGNEVIKTLKEIEKNWS